MAKLNPLKASGFVYITLDRFISSIRSLWFNFIVTMFYSNSCLNANGVDPDQSPRSAASDLGLPCLLKHFIGPFL